MTPDEFRNIRDDLGLSQAKMAKTLGVCRRSIQYYESGEKPIPKPVKRLLLTIFFNHADLPKQTMEQLTIFFDHADLPKKTMEQQIEKRDKLLNINFISLKGD